MSDNSSGNGSKIGGILIAVGVIFFIIGATTGTITGYQGANGLYYSDYGAVGSNEWICTPALIIAIIGAVVRKASK